jgi:hypothetical protein
MLRLTLLGGVLFLAAGLAPFSAALGLVVGGRESRRTRSSLRLLLIDSRRRGLRRLLGVTRDQEVR